MRRYLELNYLENSEMPCRSRMEKKKWSEKQTNEVNERIEEKRTLLDNILCRKSN
jgi:hypothetical protein